MFRVPLSSLLLTGPLIIISSSIFLKAKLMLTSFGSMVKFSFQFLGDNTLHRANCYLSKSMPQNIQSFFLVGLMIFQHRKGNERNGVQFNEAEIFDSGKQSLFLLAFHLCWASILHLSYIDLVLKENTCIKMLFALNFHTCTSTLKGEHV